MSRLLVGSAILLALAVLLEIGLRVLWGNGVPIRTVPHPTIEYVNPASAEFERFGNRIAFNAYGMRGPDFPRTKQSPGDLRVLVLGDSVVEGTERLDQSALATTLARTQLRALVGGDVEVANVAAVSWGPPNLLAFVKEYGVFDAELAFVVLSSHDYADVPDPDRATRSASPPRIHLAISDLLARIRGRYARREDVIPDPRDVRAAMAAFEELVDLLQQHGTHTQVILHTSRDELDRPPVEGYRVLLQAARTRGLEVTELRQPLTDAVRAGRRVYLDRIHLGPDGQRLLADVIVRETRRWLETR